MVISTLLEAQLPEFQKLLTSSARLLAGKADENEKRFISMTSGDLEEEVHHAMTDVAVDTPFNGTIELVSGLKFPDITAKGYYGVEVKAARKDNWKTTGNSVLESTRVPGIERIFLFFGQLSKPVQFKFRRYEECLPEVVVTHSPRYLVDMETPVGETIFDKINIPYDDLRSRDNPIRPIIDYYKSLLKEGDDIWWLGGESEFPAGKLIVRLWSNLEPKEKIDLRNQAMAFFPQIFSKNSKKFSRLASWLVARHGVVSTSLRDPFTAGGQGSIPFGKRSYNKIPKIVVHLHENIREILHHINNADIDDLHRYWEIGKKLNSENRVKTWLFLVHSYSKDLLKGTGLDVRKTLGKLISS